MAASEPWSAKRQYRPRECHVRSWPRCGQFPAPRPASASRASADPAVMREFVSLPQDLVGTFPSVQTQSLPTVMNITVCRFRFRPTGWELFRFPNALSTAPDRDQRYPEAAQQVPQNVLEDVLRARLHSLPNVTWSAGVAAEQIEQTAEHVVVHATELATGTRLRIRCRYLVGCDGARSLVRQQAGIGMDGDEVLAHNVAAVFRAPTLWSVHDKRPGMQYWMVNPETPGILGPLDASELWWFHLNEAPTGGRLPDDEVRRLFFRAVGREVPCELVANGPWTAQRLIARQYRRGRVFLLGDAAHLHPPMGGYGMNMGIGDAVDLGWKLAAVLHGWGGAERCLYDLFGPGFTLLRLGASPSAAEPLLRAAGPPRPVSPSGSSICSAQSSATCSSRGWCSSARTSTWPGAATCPISLSTSSTACGVPAFSGSEPRRPDLAAHQTSGGAPGCAQVMPVPPLLERQAGRSATVPPTGAGGRGADVAGRQPRRSARVHARGASQCDGRCPRSRRRSTPWVPLGPGGCQSFLAADRRRDGWPPPTCRAVPPCPPRWPTAIVSP